MKLDFQKKARNTIKAIGAGSTIKKHNCALLKLQKFLICLFNLLSLTNSLMHAAWLWNWLKSRTNSLIHAAQLWGWLKSRTNSLIHAAQLWGWLKWIKSLTHAASQWGWSKL